MIDAEHIAIAPLGALFALPEEGSTLESLLRLLAFAAIFVGPAIVKAIRESARKRKEIAQRGTATSLPEEQEQESEVPGIPSGRVDPTQEPAAGGREQWERLMRGELPSAPPPLPAPIPVSTSLERAPQRRVLTETRALTEAPALTDTPALTDARPLTVATPETSLEAPVGYDNLRLPDTRLGREFAEFEAPTGLASDREGGPTKRVGDRTTFAGSDAFQSLSVQGAQSEVGQRASGGQEFDVNIGQRRSAARNRMTRAQLRRALVLAEIVGPPVGMRELESGPTRPLGWS